MTPRDIQASVRARLLNKARQTGDQFELMLVRYACERFLYRLGESGLRENYVLKGAGLLTLWLQDPYRSTRDLDVLAVGSGPALDVRVAVETICSEPCPADGLTFDLGSLDVRPIRVGQEHVGQRAVLRAYLGRARIRLQIDFGFGDAITPGPEDSIYPTLLPDLPAPRLRTYPRGVAIAEKFDAMVQLGRRNTRMKDFHDIWALSSEFSFDGPALQEASMPASGNAG